ncbi:uncharacterized protein LOC110019546 isoform X2 [Phalaenopsis equestris]|uniref:uncharacterized protein LOC110019546 isoform X2 n=1 Tax=Phalaenopsis equestris TaxID=78828 RepID=UPI0009E2554D|nr:uncharacterized protein LOC110019546 isoform X2 [Phalaenopsis equestris]
MEKEIVVRTLEGESTLVRISPDRRVGDLMLLLKESFPPAMTSARFYLFFKGDKLNSDSRIDNHQIEGGEFMVLVPFTKRSPQLPSQHNSIAQDSCPSKFKGNSVSSIADSIWLDIMGDISSLSDISPNDSSNNVVGTSQRRGEESPEFEKPVKRRKLSDNFYSIHDILCSDFKDILDQRKSIEFCHLVESINCLSDPTTEMCFLQEYFDKGLPGDDQCACPLWLRRVLKTFTLINVLYAFFHLQRKCLTMGFLEGALKQPNIFGLDDLCFSYVEKLSLLCPTVVVVLNKEENAITSQGSAIIIQDFSTESSNQPKITKEPRAARRLSISNVINAFEKRMIAFRTDLRKLLKSFMENRHSKTIMPSMPSLEDIITLKGSEPAQRCINVRKSNYGNSTSRCRGTVHLKPTEMVDHLRKGLGIFGQIVYIEEINERLAVYADVPSSLADVSKAALTRVGITKLYSHQAEALRSSLSGKNVVVATSTSSGKSLCYNIPVIEALSKDLEACALYIFPTKALAQDQMRALLEMTSGLDVGFNVSIYDGDTAQMDRTWIRDNARVLITNPDMLHTSILPYHAKFQRILSNLRIIVIDEAHTYKGAFGCHTALILRRLRRIGLHVYGSNPSFIFCTATSANPREHAMELAGLQSVGLIQSDGSPSGVKYFMMWNPPLQSEVKAVKSTGKSLNWESAHRRTSPIVETSYLFAEMVQHGLRCIAFCKTRKLSELVLCYTREILQETASNLRDSICVYRGGYTPQDRRRIETDLFEGKLKGVAATNALELGIDLGYIDATLHLGFPGSVASLWQQAGRSGRRSKPSLAVYVAFEGPLDQYFMKFPDKLLTRSVEYCQVDSHNEKVLEQHIACAALELPVSSQYDEKYFGPSLERTIISLKNKGHLITDTKVSATKIWSYVGPEDRPSAAVSIRAIEANRYKVIVKSTNEVLEEIEESKAFFQIYEGAVYMHQGGTYLIKSLELSEKIAFCQKADLKYFTKTRDYTDIHVVGGDLAYPPAMTTEFASRRTNAHVNACMVTTNWFGFYKIWRVSNQIFDKVDLSLPSYSYNSQAAWIQVPRSIKVAVQKNNLVFRAGLHAACHALLNVVPLYMMCNTSDLGTECANPHETRDIPERLLLYDQHSGGIGLSLQIQRLFRELLIAASELVSTCSCSHSAGCPNCVQVLTCSEYNEVLDKKAAIIILDGVIEAENT